MAHTRRVMKVRDTHLFVDDTGEEFLPVILCLHSLYLDSRMFEDFDAAARGLFRIVKPEYRGQGRSDIQNCEIISLDDVTEDILALIEILGLENVNILAQSMGADVAIRMAEHRPTLFRRIVMASCSAREEAENSRLAWAAQVGVNGFVGPFLSEALAQVFGETMMQDHARADTVRIWSDRISIQSSSLIPAMLGEMTRENVLDRLSSIVCPVLVFAGSEDSLRPPALSAEVVDRVRGYSQLVVLERVGQSPFLEVPEIVYPRAVEFFRS